MRWIIPQSVILLWQSFRILGSDPLYSWNNYFREKNTDGNVIFFGTYSSNNLPVPAIIMNMSGLIEEWRWRDGEGGWGVV